MFRHFRDESTSMDPGFLFFPRIYPIGVGDLPYYFRWCLTSGESHADDDRDFVYVVRDLKASVTVTPTEKAVRRKDLAALVGQKGWLQVRLLTVKEREESPYLLASVLTDRNRPSSFDLLNPLLDFVTSVGELKEFPAQVEKTMEIDFERARAMSLSHWREHRMRSEKNLVIEKLELCEKRILAIEESLKNVKRELGRVNFATNGENQRKQDLLLGERARLRTELSELDDRDSKLTQRLIKANARAHETDERTLFSVEWKVNRPLTKEQLAAQEEKTKPRNLKRVLLRPIPKLRKKR